MRFAGYVRVSDVHGRDAESNGRQFRSPTEQREKIEAWAQLYGHEIVEIVEDLNSSGTKKRPKLERLVERVTGLQDEHGKLIREADLDGIVVARHDRFARSLRLALRMLDRIEEAGGQYVAVENQFDTTTPAGELALNMTLSVGQFESRNRERSTRYAIEKRLREGKPWGRCTLGYDKDAQGFLRPNDDAEYVREAFRRFAEGESVRGIAKSLRERGVQSADGAVTTRYVRDLLRNDVYIGVLRAGDVEPGKHDQPLVDKDVWAEVQTRLVQRPPLRPVHSALGGLVRCWSCRRVMSATWSDSKQHGKRRAYVCRDEQCQRRAFALEDHLLPLAEEAFFEQVKDIEKRRMAENGDELRKLEEERAQTEEKIERLREAIARLDHPADVASITESINSQRQRIVRVEKRLRELASEPSRNGLPELTTLTQEWPTMPMDEKKRLFMLVFASIVVMAPEKKRDHSIPVRERTRFLPNSEAEKLPRPGRNSIRESFPDFADRDYWPDVLPYRREPLLREFKDWLHQAHGGRWAAP
jgi:DNA invertase Pin-like site-specific DNA recombinase